MRLLSILFFPAVFLSLSFTDARADFTEAPESRIYFATSYRLGFHMPWPKFLVRGSQVRVSYWESAKSHFRAVLPLIEVTGTVVGFGINEESTTWIDGIPDNRVSLKIESSGREFEIYKSLIHEIYMQHR